MLSLILFTEIYLIIIISLTNYIVYKNSKIMILGNNDTIFVYNMYGEICIVK
jgi:hypothetical protein